MCVIIHFIIGETELSLHVSICYVSGLACWVDVDVDVGVAVGVDVAVVCLFCNTTLFITNFLSVFNMYCKRFPVWNTETS